MACKRSWVRSPSTPPIAWILALLLFSAHAKAEDDSLRRAIRNRDFWTKVNPREFVNDEFLGYQHNPNTTVHHVQGAKDLVIWDVQLTFDEYGHRKTNQSHPERRKRFLAVFGCSFVLGTGLQDDETLPTFLASELPQYHVYNTAIGASGTSMMLAKVQDPRLRQALKETSGLFVYVPIADHINRANIFFEESHWNGNSPVFEKDANGEMRRVGSARQAYPIRLWLFEKFSSLRARFFPFRRFVFPPLMESHIRYTCDLIKQADRDFRRLYPDSLFIVAPHPLNHSERLVRCVKEEGIPVVEVSIPNESDNHIPIDGHPSARFNRIYAAKLAEALGPYLNLTSINNPIKEDTFPPSTGPRGKLKR